MNHYPIIIGYAASPANDVMHFSFIAVVAIGFTALSIIKRHLTLKSKMVKIPVENRQVD